MRVETRSEHYNHDNFAVKAAPMTTIEEDL
jgi:hypothetical protein